MIEDHEAIQELLAGYALRSLADQDAVEADQLLTHHVPACSDCRATMQAFGAVAADLSLDAPAGAPPAPRPAAGLALVLGAGGMLLARDGGDVSVESLADIQQALDFALRDDAQTVDMGPVTEVAAPGVETFFLYGTAVPQPQPGMVYRLWAVSDSQTTFLADFLPSPTGLVVIRIDVDATTFERVAVTVEAAGTEPSVPGQPAWVSAA